VGIRTTATPEEARETFRVILRAQRDGSFLATCAAPVCMSRGATEAEALEKVKKEIRYRIEWCPCTGVGDDYVQLQVERG
jgi:hypothetical protein